MPSSGNPSWFQTAGQLMLSAALELGAVGLGDSLDDTEALEMTTRLNSMLAKWSSDMQMFRDASATITITGGTGAATLPDDVLDIRTVRHNVSSTNKRLLAPWNRDEFFQIPNRTQAGNPIAYYYSQQVEGDQIYLWPVPAANVDLDIDYGRAFYFVEAPEQTLDLPKEWHEAALYGLAARCAGMFGAVSSDPQLVARIDAQARSAYEKLLDRDRPDSFYFLYDSPVEAGG